MNSIRIRIPEPKWESNLANLIIDLEKLKVKRIEGEIPEYIFLQLKEIFHKLETLGSARIEGNNTTLSEYIEKIIENKFVEEEENEILNIEEAIDFIEEHIEHYSIDRMFVSQIHKIITKDLTPPPKGEGSKYPGELRKHNVTIQKSKHRPPDVSILNDCFEEFIRFINEDRKEQYQLLMIAIAHHRFAYIHPYDNANGRVGRLLNYALLIKFGFQVRDKRILNPSSVFYSDRDRYYEMLSCADSLLDEDLLTWCEYFLKGLKNEIEKIDILLKREFVVGKILFPSIKYALERKLITSEEKKVLHLMIDSPEMSIKSQDLSRIGINGSVKKSRFMEKLKERKFIKPIKEGGRIYTINFTNNYLLRGVIKSLEKEGFVSDFLERRDS